jgi:hypothetical protein
MRRCSARLPAGLLVAGALTGAAACSSGSKGHPALPVPTSAATTVSPAASVAPPLSSAQAAASVAAGTQSCGSISFAGPTPLTAESVVAQHVSCLDAGKVIAGALGKKGGAYAVAPFHCPAATAHDNLGTYDYTCTNTGGGTVTFTVPDAVAVSTASAAIS